MDSQDSAAVLPTSEATPETAPGSSATETDVSPPKSASPWSPDPVIENRSEDVGAEAEVKAASVEEGFETASDTDDQEEPSSAEDASSNSKASVLPPENSAPAAPALVGAEEEVSGNSSGGENGGVRIVDDAGVNLASGGDESSAGHEASGDVGVSSNVAEREIMSGEGEIAALEGDKMVEEVSKQNPETENSRDDEEEEDVKEDSLTVESDGSGNDHETLGSLQLEEESSPVIEGGTETKDKEVERNDSTDEKIEAVVVAADLKLEEEMPTTAEVVKDGSEAQSKFNESETASAEAKNMDVDMSKHNRNVDYQEVHETAEAESDPVQENESEISAAPDSSQSLDDAGQETSVVISEDVGAADESDAAKGDAGAEVSGNDVLDVASKDEPEVEGSADTLERKKGNEEHDAGTQDTGKDSLEAETYVITAEMSDTVNAAGFIAENAPADEDDTVKEKMEPEPQKIHADASVDASETKKYGDLPVVEAGEVNSRDIDNASFKYPGTVKDKMEPEPQKIHADASVDASETKKYEDMPVTEAGEVSSRDIDDASFKYTGIGENGILEATLATENESTGTTTSQGVADDHTDGNMALDETEEEGEALISDGPPRVAIIESSEAAKQMIQDMGEDSDGEVGTDEEGDGNELFDSAALTALLKAAAGSSADGSITLNSEDASRIFSVDRPAGLGSSVPSLKPAPPRTNRSTLFTPSELQIVGDEEIMDEEERKLHEKVDNIRVKFLRLVQRLKHSPEDTVAGQVLYRLGLAEGIRRGRQNSRVSNIENAKRKALQLEADGRNDLDFSCNILVIGKTGVGKSATINSIFGEEKTHISAFESATKSVKIISGVVDGVKIQVIDTPGLRASAMEQSANRKILSSIKKLTKKCPPDIVLYVDRLDSQTRDLNDLPLLRSITSTLASSIWFNAIVALTHAASAPPEGPNGTSLGYDVFVAQRSHIVQHLIRQAAGDMRLMNPVALVENHPSCRRNREGERVLPNGQSWRSQMLLLCYSSKILSEANSLLKLQDSSPAKLFGLRLRSPPLPFLLSSLLQSRAHPKLSPDQGGDNGDSDLELDDLSDADENEDEDEYDQLPPFKPLRKAQIGKLTKEQRRAYFEEYDYRVKLLQKKQLKEELKRMREMKKRGKTGQGDVVYDDMAEDYDQDAAPASVPVPLPDMMLPPSFDCENPVYRYRFLEPTSQLLTRPVLDTHGWDHDCGYDGVSIEQSLALAGRFPVAAAVQITKDKKDFSIHLDSSIAAKHGENGSTLACFDVQPIGKQLGYTLRGETKFKNFKKNKSTGGISITFLGETVATGMKVEDQLLVGKRVVLVASTGAVRAQGDMAYGANLEARLRDKDFPIGQSLSTFGLSLMRWRGDLALGANLQSQFSVGRNSKMAVRVGLNNKLTGQVTVKTSTSEQLQIALIGMLPIAASIFRSIWSGEFNMNQ